MAFKDLSVDDQGLIDRQIRAALHSDPVRKSGLRHFQEGKPLTRAESRALEQFIEEAREKIAANCNTTRLHRGDSIGEAAVAYDMGNLSQDSRRISRELNQIIAANGNEFTPKSGPLPYCDSFDPVNGVKGPRRDQTPMVQFGTDYGPAVRVK